MKEKIEEKEREERGIVIACDRRNKVKLSQIYGTSSYIREKHEREDRREEKGRKCIV